MTIDGDHRHRRSRDRVRPHGGPKTEGAEKIAASLRVLPNEIAPGKVHPVQDLDLGQPLDAFESALPDVEYVDSTLRPV